jgi:uncharacterized protein (DUF1778 family)
MATATERLEFRVAPAARARIDRAARLVGEPVTAFARRAAEERAERVVAEYETVTIVPPEFFDSMLAALDQPPRPNAALAAAGDRWREVVIRG